MKGSTHSKHFRINYGQTSIRFWSTTYLLFFIAFGYVDYLAAPINYTNLWFLRLAVLPFFFLAILSTYIDFLCRHRKLINALMVFTVPFSIILMITQVDATEWARYMYFAGIVLSVFPIGFILMDLKLSTVLVGILAVCYLLIVGIGLDYRNGDTPFFVMSSCFVVAGFAATLMSTYLLENNQRRIIRQSEELEMLVKLKDKFIGVLAHDLRAPCSNVTGFADLYLNNPDSFESRETVNLIHEMKKSATGMQTLLQNVLEWSKLRGSHQTVNPVLFKVKDILEDNLDFARGTARLKRIALVSKYEDPNLTAYSDPNMLSTVLRNLISNALKFSYQGGKVLVRFHEEQDEIFFSVADEGVGIAEREAQQLFTSFENPSTPGTNNEPGSGLGLVLCKEMIEKCGGEIWVESKEDEGSTFTFKIPVHYSHKD